ncbi:FGGY carbohydrate kinase domain-containing protein [Durusdinium trenchii]|uniref:FGGY carbohydrate kinase domain-containing protein n=1 Tax=Durusdinium trenchii TaxID=1381693 RepID=A0ABP0RET3_9DINO
MSLGLGPTAALEASGAPSRWLRVRQKLSYTAKEEYTTPAEEQHINSLYTDLCSKDGEVRHKAAEALASLCKGERLAKALAGNLPPMLRGLKAGEDAPVKLAILGALRSIAEKNDAIAVAQHSYALLPCLKDENILVQRKVSALYRVLAEEGAAAMVARDVTSIMHCFESTQASNSSLSAPLEALAAIACAGEGAAVARVVERLLIGLRDPRPKIRCGTCTTMAAIGRGGAKELLGYLGLVEDPEAIANAGTLFEMLVCVALDDKDETVRLAAADALRCLPEADPDTCDETRQRFPKLVERVRKLYSGYAKGETEEILLNALGITTGEACVICQDPLHLDGGPLELRCGHIFHKKCCESWIEWVKRCNRTPSCPLCRAHIFDAWGKINK